LELFALPQCCRSWPVFGWSAGAQSESSETLRAFVGLDLSFTLLDPIGVGFNCWMGTCNGGHHNGNDDACISEEILADIEQFKVEDRRRKKKCAISEDIFADLEDLKEKDRHRNDTSNSECSTAASSPSKDCDDRTYSFCSDILSELETRTAFSESTLTIFDWDDTLFPTSWMVQQRLLSAGITPSSEQEIQLQRVADCTRNALQTALAVGKVVIVTNAVHGWAETSCARFMPSVVSLLNTVEIVSAQSKYDGFAHTPSEWKELAFAHEVGTFCRSTGDGQQQHNILSVGDAMYEVEALKAVTKGMSNGYGKSVKLMERPTIQQLIEQHELLSLSFLDIVDHVGDLDVETDLNDLQKRKAHMYSF